MTKVKKLSIFAWTLSTVVFGIAFIAWADTYSWRFSNLSTYKLFPLFGLIAFSLMWAHYIVGAIRLYFDVDKKPLIKYYEATAFVVLFAILLHPGLLWWQLWRDGEGLPPASVTNVVPESLKIFTIMGSISLLIFLSFELRRFYQNRKWWKFIDYANVLAMALIFVHALKLGGALSGGWFLVVWIYYGISLVMAVIYWYYKMYKLSKANTVKK